MQDFTGIPAIADLAAMRDKVFKIGRNVKKINPFKEKSVVKKNNRFNNLVFYC